MSAQAMTRSQEIQLVTKRKLQRRISLKNPLLRERSGRKKRPRLSGIPTHPRTPVPRMRLKSTVSATSSRLCPRAIPTAPQSSAARVRPSYRILLAAASSDSPRTLPRGTSIRTSRKPTSQAAAIRRTKDASASDSAPRMP